MPVHLHRVCVFCGSNYGARDQYSDAATKLGSLLAEHGIGLVYGGARVGLMGVVADAALAAGGEVIGVMPQALVDREIAHSNLTKLHIVHSMHERKQMMADLSDAFVALPGGFGTFEEFCEVLTWNQIGIHNKPCGILNTLGYYDGLLAMFNHGVQERFIPPAHHAAILASSDCRQLLALLRAYKPVSQTKWLEKSEA